MVFAANTPHGKTIDPGVYRGSWTGSVVTFEYRDRDEWVLVDERACENVQCWVIVDQETVMVCDDEGETREIALRGLV